MRENRTKELKELKNRCFYLQSMTQSKINQQIPALIQLFQAVAGKRIVIGFSGGPDSTLLLHLALKARELYSLELFCAHINHQWRDVADEEQEFCRQICEVNNVPFFATTADKFDVKWNGSKEAQAREIRQQFFAQVLAQTNSDLLALGHNQTDQIETFFIKLLRGSSLDGLSCMRMLTDTHFRPLINTSKPEVLELCRALELKFCTDQSNLDLCFTRNKIRHQLLPVLETLAPDRALPKICQTIELLAKENNLVKNMALAWLKEFQTSQGVVTTQQFLTIEETLAMRVLKQLLTNCGTPLDHSQGVLREIYRFLGTNKSSSHKIGEVVITKKKGYFSIR